MKLRHLFAINIIFAAFFGLGCSFFPNQMFQMYGLTPDAGGVWVTRLAGGSLLGFATLMCFGWKSAPAEARRAIALALLIQDVIGLMASMEIQLSGAVGAIGWSSPALYLMLALGYAYFLFIKPRDV
ncbi:MAG: hypothetical protein AABZ02_00165 [Bacteroidota bacterium]